MNEIVVLFFALAIFFLFFALKYSELKPWLGYSQYFVYSILWWVLWLLFLHFVWSWRRSARLIFYSLSKMISFEFGLIYMHVTFNELQSLCWICPFEKKPKKKKNNANQPYDYQPGPGQINGSRRHVMKIKFSAFVSLFCFFANLSLNSNELQMKSR